jgi:tetratricopeptide (TPR) repeat protein
MSTSSGSGEEIDTLALKTQPDREPPPSAEEFPRGTTVDRYVILDRLGKGGMGSVYSAYDPQLDRRVALKFLHRWLQSDASDGADGPEGFTARLVREAQAMGRLSHPNVVAVYDVGVSEGGRVFLAMEMVEGGTLVSWLEERKPGWRDVLQVFCEAGEGLAAAHRAGVIHRDFKLDNVLMGVDGRPRVMDFGVARTAERELRVTRPESGGLPALVLGVESLSGVALHEGSRLTLTGTFLGTPGYMAPEQYGDAGVDERADVFAFCATLYRALYGERAFEGESFEQIAAATLQGRVRAVPRGSTVPAWVWRILLRGLAVDRDARPRSMHELLVALRSDPAKRRRRWLAAGALVAASCLVAAGAHQAGQRRVQECRAAAGQLRGVWDAPRRATIERAFRATGVAYADDTWARVDGEVGRYARAWADEATVACLETAVRHERSEAMFDLQRTCLDDRLDELRALTDTLAAADAKTVELAVQAAGALTPIAPCASLERLGASDRLPADASSRTEIRALQGEVAAAKALVDSGKEVQGLERLTKVARRVDATGYGPLMVSFALAKGRADAAGDPQAAADDFLRAALMADAHKLDQRKAEALIELGDQAHALARFDDSHRWMLLASAAIDRLGGDATLEATRDVREGWVYACETKYDLAVPLFERALERARAAHLDVPLLVARAHSGLGDAFAAQDRDEAAIEHMRVALKTVEGAYGARHPAVAELTVNLATTQLDSHHVSDALATALAAQASLDAAARRGDIPPTSGRIGDAARTVGLALLRSGRAAEAAPQLAHAVDVYRADDKESDEMALAATELAEAQRVLGNPAAAIARLDDAAKIEARVVRIPAETIAGTLAVRGRIALDRGATLEALQLAERAFEVLKSDELARARSALALARRGDLKEPGKARALAQETTGVFGGILAELP